jgi:hypothetical protein
MSLPIRLVDTSEITPFVPLGVLGYCLSRSHFLDPVFRDLHLPLKIVDHTPQEKLVGLLFSILIGCRSVSQSNTRLRPDLALARAWGWEHFAEQSSIARTLDAFETEHLVELRCGSEKLFRQESQVFRHLFGKDWLWFDLDFSPLPISKHAEGSRKGKMGEKNSYGRQLARVHAPQYHETLFSHLYPGNQQNIPAYIPVLQSLDQFLAFTAEQKLCTILRTDAGFGSDDNIDYALDENWQILTKGFSGQRAMSLVRKADPQSWFDLGKKRWVMKVQNPPTYIRPVQFLLLRWLTEQEKEKQATVICSILEWSLEEVIAHYDDRGSCETEIQADKGGLKLEQRRKKHLAAQEALVLITDLAHNLLAWATRWAFPGGAFAALGTERLIEDVFAIPGRLLFEQNELKEVQLNQEHPYAAEVAEGLQQLLRHFDLR